MVSQNSLFLLEVNNNKHNQPIIHLPSGYPSSYPSGHLLGYLSSYAFSYLSGLSVWLTIQIQLTVWLSFQLSILLSFPVWWSGFMKSYSMGVFSSNSFKLV